MRISTSTALRSISALLCGTSFLATVWIVMPAISRETWLLALVAGEWNLLFASLAVVGIAGGLSLQWAGKWPRRALLTLGILALLFALYPSCSAFRVAEATGVRLSLYQYSSGFLPGREPVIATDFATYTFAVVDGRELHLDAYKPPASILRNGASVVVVHGGSWNAGDRNDFPQWDRWLAGQGYTVFDIDYRLAPQPNYQTATGDVKCAIQWVKRHSAQFQVSPDHIALLGRSAGAHLSLLAAYSAADPRLPSSCDSDAGAAEPRIAPNVNAVVSFYGPTDLPWDYDHPANQRVLDSPATLRHFVGGSPHDSMALMDRYLLASPIAHVTRDVPPTLLIHGGHDQLVLSRNTQALDAELTNAAVSHTTIFIPYAQHGFDYNFNGWGSQIVQPLLLRFLARELRVPSSPHQ